jgi:hypothetical protein
MSKTSVTTTELPAYSIVGNEYIPFNELRQKDFGVSSFVALGQSFTPLPALSPAQDVPGFYMGAVYSPSNDRIYFVPGLSFWNFTGSGNPQTWQYMDCQTGKLVYYAGDYLGVGYSGGAYDPINDRIYFVPSSPVAGKTLSYLDCKLGTVNSFVAAPTSMVDYPYSGAAYSPTLNRIYLAPHCQSDQATWHYIDCISKTLVSYTPACGALSANAYNGAVYSPSQDRIYFIPSDIASSSTWHYVDNTGTVQSYPADSMALWTTLYSSWSSVSQIQSINLYNSKLYLNAWTDTGTVTYSWDGATWTALVDSGWPVNTWASGQIIYNNLLFSIIFGGPSNIPTVRTYNPIGGITADVSPSFDSNTFIAPSQVVYGGKLYIGTQNEVIGPELWEYDGTSWSSIPVPWYSASVWDGATTEISALASFSDLLLIATLQSGQPQLYTWDGTTFTNITPWEAAPGYVTGTYLYDGALYVCLSSFLSGASIWEFPIQTTRVLRSIVNTPPKNVSLLNNASWYVPGAYVIAESGFRNQQYFALYSPGAGVQLWRGSSSLYEKVVSFSYNFVSIYGLQDATLGSYLLTGQDIADSSAIMKNAAQTVYSYGASYNGGVYSPMQNRIYLVPSENVVDPSWQYIDCETGNVLTYEHGLSSPNPCAAGAYSPAENVIYFGRSIDQSTPASVIYVNCSTGVFSTLSNSLLTSGNLGVIYSSTQHSTFLVPFSIPSEPIVNITVLSNDNLSPIIMSNPAYGKA